MAHPGSTTASANTTTSFYRRELPTATCVAFSSPHGRAIFASALQHRGLRSYFHVMEQYKTQAEPAYCGLSTLVMALNAFAVDPLETWKGPWRWYEERMLNCCVDLEHVQQTGITLPVFRCLAVCQGLHASVQYVDETSLEDFRQAVIDAYVEEDRDDLAWASVSSGASRLDRVLVVSYNRKVLQQTGSGHFSPLAAYDEASDSVLILDTARFKYGAHWVRLPLLYDAMQPIDPATGRSRGHVTLIHYRFSQEGMEEAAATDANKYNLPTPLLVRSEMFQLNALRHFKTNVVDAAVKNQNSVSHHDVVNYCTQDGTRGPDFVWELTQPQLARSAGAEVPAEVLEVSQRLMDEVRSLLRALFPLDAAEALLSGCNNSTNTCRPDRCRTVPLLPREAMGILFLACLDDRGKAWMETTLTASSSFSESAKEQLIAEATVLRYAIDASVEQHTSLEKV